MKTTFIPTIGLALSAMLISQHPFAQYSASGNDPVSQVSYSISMKKTAPYMSAASGTNLPVTTPYNTKVLARFNKQFLNVNNAKWSVAANGNWYAYFTKNGAFNSIAFNKKGGLIYQTNYVPQKELPSDLKELITGNYTEYQITGAVKVLKDSRTIWVVNLASLNHIIQLSVENGEMQQLYKLERAN
jgi:hypothetical protein